MEKERERERGIEKERAGKWERERESGSVRHSLDGEWRGRDEILTYQTRVALSVTDAAAPFISRVKITIQFRFTVIEDCGVARNLTDSRYS